MSTTQAVHKPTWGAEWAVPEAIEQLTESKRKRVWTTARDRDWLPTLRKRWNARRINPTGWGWPVTTTQFEPDRLWKSSLAVDEQEPPNWVTDAVNGESERNAVVSCLSVAYALPRLARHMEEDSWWSLVDRVTRVDDSPLFDGEPPITRVCLQAELALVIGALLQPAKKQAKFCLKEAARRLQLLAEEFLDGTGLPHAHALRLVRPWLAAWTRCRDFALQLELELPERESEQQYGWMVRRALQLTRGDGTSALSDSSSWEGALVDLALELDDDPVDCQIAQQLQLLRLVPKNRRKEYEATIVRESSLPEPSDHSEWAQAAVFRSGWKRKSAVAALTYTETEYHAELGIRCQTLLSGAVNNRVTLNGTPLRAKGEWTQTCWFSDRSSDYLELEVDLTGGWRLQRQLLFERTAKLVLLADAVLGSKAGNIESTLSWDLAGSIEYRPEEETEDGWLVSTEGPQAWLAPLWAPEWRDGSRRAALDTRDGKLICQAESRGTALYLPLLIDLHSRRRSETLRTWRALTVAEQLRTVDADEAVGYRVQVGRKKQWLIYRSLAPSKSRTVLGQNFNTEFFAGRFYRTGEAVPYVEVEAE